MDDSTTSEEIKKIDIIYQSPGRKWLSFKDVHDYDEIFCNMYLSCTDIYNSFKSQINQYKDNEYTIQG